MALLAAIVLASAPAVQPDGEIPIVSAHNLDQRMVYIFFDPDTKAVLDARIPTLTPPQPLLQVGDEIGMIIKVIPTDGTVTGVGGYIDFYVPNGVTVLDAAYVLPNNAGGYDLANMKGQALMPSVGAGGGPTTSLVGINRGPNILGVTSPIVTPGNLNLGTLPGIYGDTGIFYSTDPETAYNSWVTLKGGGTITNNSGDTFSPYNAWDAEQMAGYGIKGTTNPNYPSVPLLDSNGRGNAPWGLSNVVAGPQSGYAWDFELDDYAACDPIPYAPSTACLDAATDQVGPWNRIQYPGSQIADDPPGNNPAVQPYTSGADGSTVGFDLSPATPLAATVSQVDGSSPKAIRWAVGQLTNGRPEYAWVKFRVNDLTAIIDPSGCPLFHADTFGGDAGGDSNGKDHLWRYYDPTKVTWNGCLAVGKPATRQAVKVGDTFQYKVSVYNASPTQDMSSVVVRDTLPSGVQFVSAVPAQNSGPNPLVWNVGTLLRGQKFEATVTVKATSSGILENRIEVTGVTTQGGDPVTSTATDSTLSGNYPILKQSKSVSPTAIAPGDSVQYTVEIENIGSGPSISPVKIEEHLPTGFSYASLNSVTVNGTNALGSTTVNASQPNDPIFTVAQPINAGRKLVLVFTASTAPNIPPGSNYCNVFTSFTNVPLTTGSEACVTVGGGAIGDTIYRDWSGDGIRNPATEEGISGVTVNLYAGSCPPSGGIIGTDVTDASGNYLINGLIAGTYCVETVPPANHTVTGDPEGALDGFATVTLAENEENFDIDFGLQPGGVLSIGDLVFEDMGNDGNYDPGAGDVGIPNVTVNLYEDSNLNGIIDPGDALVATTSTDASGLYSFSGLAPGFDYIVDVDELDPDLAIYFGGAPTLQTTDDPQAVPNLTANYTAADFGFYEIVPGSIGDEVCIDSNADGSCAGEEPLPNVTVSLFRDGNGNGVLDFGEPVLATTTTSITGTYRFDNLPPGDYIVDVDQNDSDVPGGYFPSVDQIAVSLALAENRSDVDFPFVQIMSKAVDKTQADPGETLTYTVTVRYPGTALLSNVLVTDPIPSGTTYVADSDAPEANVTPADDATATQIAWNLGTNSEGTPGRKPGVFLCAVDTSLSVLADTYVREDNAGDNFGARTLIETNPQNNGAGNSERHGLLRFDIGGIPSSATIKQANLKAINTNSRSNHVIELREATRSWTEGTQTGNTCTTGASWNAPNCTDTGTGWNGSGGNFRTLPSPWGATVLGSMDASSTGTKSVNTANLRQLVQDWVSGAKNNRGLVMLSTGTDTGQVNWGVKENGNGAVLDVRYEFLQEGGCPSMVALNASADTYVREDNAGDNFGARTLIETNPQNNGAGNSERHGLLRFNLNTIPAGATITGATLEVVNTGARNDHVLEVREATRSWTEGAQTGNACIAGASWNAPNCTDTVTGWNGSGGNFRSSPSPWGTTLLGTMDASSTGIKSVGGADLTQLVQAWVDGGKVNRGLVLLATGTDGGQAQWGTRENGNGARLIVSYRSEIVTADLPVLVDTYVREDQPTRNYGARAPMETNPDNNGAGNSERHGLLRFDMTALPTGATVTDASLRLQNVSARANHGLSVREALRAWTEGSQSDATCTIGASWNAPNCTDTGTGWNGLGGNFRSSPSPWGATALGSLSAATTGLKTASSADMTQLIRDWVDGTKTNRGFVLLATGTDNGLADWGVRETGNGAVLRVSYLAPGGGAETRTRLSAGPSLVADGDLIQITMALTATETLTNVVPTSPITVTASNGAVVTGCTGPAPASQDVISGTIAIFSYSCTADTSGVTALPASVSFAASATSPGGTDFAVATSNSVLFAPPLTFQVTVDGPPALVDPVINTATISDDNIIPPTSDSATTAIQASIGDRVWADLNGDGVQDPGEPGLAGVEVCATPVGGGTPICATTDGSGDYRIYGLDQALDYTVMWAAGTVPTDYVATTPMLLAVSSAQLQAAGGYYSDADFGLRPPGDASIGDTVWIDADEDGVVEVGENLLAGIRVELYDGTGTNLLATTTTDASGNYLFDGLYAGDYVVRVDETSTVTTPFGVVTTIGAAMELVSGSPSNPVAVNVPTDSSDIFTVDFGYNWAGSIGDTTYYDDNGNGVRDGLEAIAPNVVVTLNYDLNGNGEIDSGEPLIGITTTDASGNYLFDNLPPGNYVVKGEEQTVESPTTPGTFGTMVPTTGEEIGVSLAPSEDYLDADIGFIEAALVEGHVFHDVSNNGVLDPSEPGLTPVEVTLSGFDIGNNPILLTTTTDADGEYEFIVPPGTYTITYSQSDVEAIDAGLTTVTTPSSYTISPNAGQEIGGLDFGVDHAGTIGDRVYNDANGDGSQQPGEPGLAGVTVQLYDATGTMLLDQVATDADGSYLFTGLADGNYIVRVDESTIPLADPPGFTQTQDPDEGGTCSTCDAEGTATVSGGGSDLSLDFGYQPNAVLHTISGTVYVDINNNGDDDDGPGNGFAGVTVSVVCDSGSFSIMTDANGDWSISGIPDGSTCTVLDADEDDLPSTAFLSTEAPSTPITVDADLFDLDFGYFEVLASISGTVCVGNGNGQCAGETGIPNVDVTLTWAGPDGILGTGDDVVTVVQTDGNGDYSFPNLEPGLYRIVETNPVGYDSLADSDGGNPDDITTNLALGENKIDQDFEDAPIGSPAIQIQKTVYVGHDAGAGCPGGELVNDFDGTSITYCFAVTNTGDTYLDAVSIDDANLGIDETDMTLLGAPIFPLAPAASASWFYETTISGDLINTADVSANPTDDSGNDLLGLADPTDSDTAEVDGIVPGTPGIRITKSADPTTVYAGMQVIYTYLVDNTGDTILDIADPIDDRCGPLSYQSGDANNVGLLDIGETWVFACSTALTMDTTNTVQVTGTPTDDQGDPIPGLSPVTDMDIESVDVINPAVDLRKVAVPARTTPGGSVTYGFFVTNPGDDPLANVALSDDTCGPISSLISGDANNNGLLDPGETWLYRCSTTLSEDTLNIASVTADDSLGGAVTDTGAAFVDVVFAGLDIEKSADATIVYSGTLVTYTYTAVNTGQDPLSNVAVTDDRCGPVVFDSGDTNTDGELDAGETWTYLCSQILTSDTMNLATGTAEDPLGNPVEPDGAVETVAVIHPAIEVEKSVSPTVIEAGQQVVYHYVVTNPGDDPLSNVSLSDDTCSPVSGPQAGGDANSDGFLDPGETWAYACGASPTVDTTNTVTASGDDRLGNPVQDTDTAFVGVVAPAIELVKTVSESTVYPGTVVTYTLEATNTGDVALDSVGVNDDTCSPVTGPDPAGDPNNNGLLDPGETWIYVCSAVVDDDVTNRATVVANPVDANGDDLAALGDVNDSDTADVNVINPVLELVKTVDQPLAAPGSTVTWTFTVTNIGDDPVTSVLMTDNTCGPVTGPDPAGDLNNNGVLDPGEAWEYSCSDVVNDDTVNVAMVTGEDSLGNPVTAEATAYVDPQDVDLTIVKSVDPAVIYPGELVTYTYEVSNSGGDPAVNVSISDDRCGPVVYLGGDNGNDQIEPSGNEIWVFQCQTTLGQDTTNVATVTGEDLIGNPLEPDTATATVNVINPKIRVVKWADPLVVTSGGSVTYGYSVRNPGDDPLADVSLSDDTCSPVNGPTSGDANANNLLDPGETWSYDCTTTLATDTTNTVTASGDDSLGNPVMDQDTAFVDVVSPSIQIEKSVTAGGVCPGLDSLAVASGTGVTYCYRVTNTGDTYLSNIAVTDDVLGAVCTIAGPLAPGAMRTCIGAAIATVDVENTGSVTANPTDALGNDLPGLDDPSDDDTALIDIVAPGIEVQKTVYPGHDGGAGCAGGELVSDVSGANITYCFEVTNTGDTDLDGLGLLDLALGLTLAQLTPLGSPSFPLPPSASATWYFETTVLGDLVNTARVSANPTDDQGNDLPGLVNPTDSDTSEVEDLGPPTSCLGDQIFFDFDNDGIFEPGVGEFGIDGLLINLYLDSDNSGELSVGDTFVAATTSAQGGRFEFCDLVDGEYILQVDPINFAPGGTLASAQSSAGNDVLGQAPDPDDDVDGDDNGSPDIEGGVSTAAVTLTFDNEPTSEDGDSKTNYTVDFGFALRELPTGVRLSGFSVERIDDETVEVRWSTSSEIGVVGFRVLRSDNPEGPFVPIDSDLVPASDSVQGASYARRDVPGAPGTYFYGIEVVNADSSRQFFGTIEVEILPRPMLRLYLPALWQRNLGR